MFTKKSWGLVPAATLLMCPLMAEAKTLTEALTTGKASVNARLRYENVDDTFFKREAEAMTIRTRVGYETSPFHSFTALVEMEDTHALGGMDNYQLPGPPATPATGNAVIADLQQTELNRVQLRYRGISRLDATVGRQRLMFDNQRWVGNVGFRQNEQTFDAFSAIYTGIPDWTLTYAYVDRVYGITDVMDSDVTDSLFNVAYSGFTLGKISAYAYQLSNQEKDFTKINPGLRFIDNDTYGMRFDGAYILPTTVPLRAIYRAEYAEQDVKRLSGASTVDNDAEYMLAEFGMGYTFGSGAYTLIPLAGYEVLGSDDGKYGLQTPYATKHAFQGWVDQFLVTPNEGVRATYVSLGFDLNFLGTKFLAAFHDFDSDEKNTTTKRKVDFGKEWNFQVTKAIGANWILGSKVGKYEDGDATAAAARKDSTKLWAWVELNF